MSEKSEFRMKRIPSIKVKYITLIAPTDAKKRGSLMLTLLSFCRSLARGVAT